MNITPHSIAWFAVGLWFAFLFWKFFDWDERNEKKMKQAEIDNFFKNKRRERNE